MFKLTKRRGIALGLIFTLAIAGGAYAYWTAGGSGTGSGSAATGTTPLTAVQNTVLTAMYPGDSAQTISGDFTNTNSGPIYVTSVTASISGVTKASGAVAGTCDSSDFTLSNPVMAVGASIPVGTAQGAWTGATIKFNNKATSQDQCKGATVSLAYAIN
jgi:hypothetical protein